MSTNPYTVGDRVRVLVDEPYGTELALGDIVTVIDTVIKVDGELEIPALIVATGFGERILGLDVVEAVSEYKPAENDDVVDAIFEKMLRADKELFTLALDADTALGATEPGVSTRLRSEDEEQHEDGDEGQHVPWHQPGGPAGNSWGFLDPDGDLLEVFYAEQNCPSHGREAAFFFTVNQQMSAAIPVEYGRKFISFIVDRLKFAERPTENEKE